MQTHAAGTRAGVSARLDLPDMKFIYTDWHRELGKRLREARLDAGYTLKHVGKALRFNWQMLQRYEVAPARMHADVLDELAMFLRRGCAVAAGAHSRTALKSVLEQFRAMATCLSSAACHPAKSPSDFRR